MALDTIPDDIIAAADAVVERGYNWGLVDAIAAALLAERLAERERICAQLESYRANTIRDIRTEDALRTIAAAIRAQNDKPTGDRGGGELGEAT